MRKIVRVDLKTWLNYMLSDFKYNDIGKLEVKTNRKSYVMQT